MEKRISYDVFQSVKRVAQACNPMMVKRDKVKAHIESLVQEYQDWDNQIKTLEAGIIKMTGFRVEELVKKVTEPGKTARYLPVEGIVTYDTATKEYVIIIPDAEQEDVAVPEQTEDVPTDEAPESPVIEGEEENAESENTDEPVF